jgi:CubicO group peptidase (beta-lactamase class C family)
VPNQVNLHAAAPGQDTNIADALTDWIAETWGGNKDNANAAVVTFTTTQTGQSGSASVDIYPSYYTAPNDLPQTSGYVIGSVQKVFTGTMLAARLVQGSMNNPIYQMFSPVAPWLGLNPTPEQKISTVTLAQLATHTSCMTPEKVPIRMSAYTARAESTIHICPVSGLITTTSCRTARRATPRRITRTGAR